MVAILQNTLEIPDNEVKKQSDICATRKTKIEWWWPKSHAIPSLTTGPEKVHAVYVKTEVCMCMCVCYKEEGCDCGVLSPKKFCFNLFYIYQAIRRHFLSKRRFCCQTYKCTHTAAAAKSRQSCPTLCDPIDGSLTGSSVPGILHARILEWVAISFSNAWKWKVKVKSLHHVWLLVIPWTVAYQAPPSMGLSRQEYWSGLLLPTPKCTHTHKFGKHWCRRKKQVLKPVDWVHILVQSC